MLLCLAICAAPAALLAQPPANGEALEQREAELARLRERIAAMTQRLEADRGDQDQLRQALEKAEKDMAAANGRLRELKQELARQDGKVRDTQAERSRTEQEMAGQKDALARQVKAAFRMGQQSPLQLMLSQDSVEPLSRLSAYYEYLGRARTARIRSVQEQLRSLADLEARLVEDKAGLEALSAEQHQTLQQLEASRAERKASMATIASRITEGQDQLRLLQADEGEMQKLLSSLHEALEDAPLDEQGADGKPLTALRGQLPWPGKGPLLARYGESKADGHASWNGIWIGMTDGAPVRSVARGRVAFVGWMQRYGLMVILEHEGGYFTLYGHNSSALRAVGDWVAAGDILAAAGNTGGYDKPGVYFEIRRGADPEDPKLWLAGS